MRSCRPALLFFFVVLTASGCGRCTRDKAVHVRDLTPRAARLDASIDGTYVHVSFGFEFDGELAIGSCPVLAADVQVRLNGRAMPVSSRGGPRQTSGPSVCGGVMAVGEIPATGAPAAARVEFEDTTGTAVVEVPDLLAPRLVERLGHGGSLRVGDELRLKYVNGQDTLAPDEGLISFDRPGVEIDKEHGLKREGRVFIGRIPDWPAVERGNYQATIRVEAAAHVTRCEGFASCKASPPEPTGVALRIER